MKAIQLLGQKRLRMAEVPIPEINENEALLKVRAASICGTDVRMYLNGYKGVTEETPLVLCHEFSGDIVRTGANVTSLKPGMKVSVAPNMGCGTCDMCVSGNTHLCRHISSFGVTMDGGLQEYVKIPEEAIRQGNVILLDEEISYQEAALVEPLSCVYNGQKLLGAPVGADTLIIGMGPIGIMHIMVAKLFGAGRILVNDLNADRLKKAKELFPDVIAIEGDVMEGLHKNGLEGVDRDWNDITSWSCSLDTRYIPYANEQMRTLKQQFLDICGTNAPLMSAKCKWFVSDYPEEASKVAKYMLISSYVIGRLGKVDIEKASLGSSYLTWTGLADVRDRTWSSELCEASGVSKELLPEIVDYHAVSGYLNCEAASELGLPVGIPLIAGAGDKIAGCIGAGILSPSDTIFEASSYGAVSVLAEGYTPNPQRYDYDAIPAAEPGQYYLHKYLPGSGITLQWFLDTFGIPDVKTSNAARSTVSAAQALDAFLAMEEAISRIPCGSEGLMAVGLLGGSAMPFDGEIRGTWVGHTWSHTKAHFYRALLESFAYELRGTMDSIAHMYPEWDRYGDVKIIGGGASSDTWRQILADVTGCAFLNYSGYDAALWGTAVLAGKGIGLFSDLKTASGGAARLKGTAVPDQASQKVYEKYMALYERLTAHMHPVCEELLAIEKEGGKNEKSL